jgi:ABC-type bacteriocin/lantibiotic exporter with double-glycine peptidase domain
MIALLLTAALLTADSEQGLPFRQPELCGAHCLFMALRALDAPIDGLQPLVSRLGDPPDGGYSLAQLAAEAEKFDLHTLGVETSLASLSRRPGRFVCIAHMKKGHFVVIAKCDERNVTVVNPPEAQTIPASTFLGQWDGKALILSREPVIPEGQIPVPWGRMAYFLGAVVLALVSGVVIWGRNRRSAK